MNIDRSKTITLNLGVWYNAETESIHIATHDYGGLITTVNAEPNSTRGHPNVFGKLAKCLAEAGAPHPAIKVGDASET